MWCSARVSILGENGHYDLLVVSSVCEQERGGRMTQGVRGNNWHPPALTGELDACVECLVAKRRAVPARKDERRSREVDSPTPPQPHAFDAFQESEPSSK